MDFLNMTVADINRKKVAEAVTLMEKQKTITLNWDELTKTQKRYLLCVICKLGHIVIADGLEVNNIEL